MDGKKPTREELLAAAGKTVPDVIGEDLLVLFCGINPGLYTAAVGHHFARPGNRFWPSLHAAGFTPRLLAPHEERELLGCGYGITNVVARATAAADELKREEFEEGGRILRAKLQVWRPAILAILGIGAYRTAFGRPGAGPGPQPEPVGETLVWVLPNPSGLNAGYSRAAIVEFLTALRSEAGRIRSGA